MLYEVITVPAHLFICDQLVYKYYTPIICNILKKQILSIKKKEYKHYTIDYWYPILNNMLSNNIQAHRKDIKELPHIIYQESFGIIIKYLIVDYSIDDIYSIFDICATYNTIDISDRNNFV